MEITATNLSQIQNGSYYLSNSTHEIKEAGFWQKFKCLTGLGDGRQKVRALVAQVKTSLLADAAVNEDADLTAALNALNTKKSISATDLRRIASSFKQTHAVAIAKSDAFRVAKAKVDEVVDGWVNKDKTVVYDPDNIKYFKKLALYATRPVIDKAMEYGEDMARIEKRIVSAMNLLNTAVGTAEEIACQRHCRYPASSTSPIPDRSKPAELSLPRFVLDEMHFRFLLATLFAKDGKICFNDVISNLVSMPEKELQRCGKFFLKAPLGGPEKGDSLEKFLASTANIHKTYNNSILETIESNGNDGTLPDDVDEAFKSLVDEMRSEFGEDAIPPGTTIWTLAEGKSDDILSLAKPICDAATSKGKLVSLDDLKDALREPIRKNIMSA